MLLRAGNGYLDINHLIMGFNPGFFLRLGRSIYNIDKQITAFYLMMPQGQRS